MNLNVPAWAKKKKKKNGVEKEALRSEQSTAEPDRMENLRVSGLVCEMQVHCYRAGKLL